MLQSAVDALDCDFELGFRPAVAIRDVLWGHAVYDFNSQHEDFLELHVVIVSSSDLSQVNLFSD